MKDVRTAADLACPVGAVGERIDVAALGLQLSPERWSQLTKFAEIGQLATGIIHEINNPVACLRANVDLLLKDFPRILALVLPDAGTLPHANAEDAPHPEAGEVGQLLQDVRESLEDLSASVALVTSISRNLKSLAYSAHDAPKETDIHACIEAALRVSGHELKYRVRVERDFGTLPRLAAYPGLLIQVFLNLFVNAAQAIDGEGVIRIRTRSDADGLIVEVSDTGRGIAPEHLPKIFHAFFTTKPLGVGLGLGLSICKRIIDRHGGNVEVSSSTVQGTAFRIRLPREAPTGRHSYGGCHPLAAREVNSDGRVKRNPGVTEASSVSA